MLYCCTGKRSSLAGQQLLSDVGDAVWHLQGGIEAWKAAGYDTEQTATASICLQRQGEMIAGALVFVGSLLSAIVSPWFLCLCGVVGVGLIFFGCTDTCGMAGLLAKLSDHQHV